MQFRSEAIALNDSDGGREACPVPSLYRICISAREDFRHLRCMGPKAFILSVCLCLCVTGGWFVYLAGVKARNSQDPLGGITLERYYGVEFLDEVGSNHNENGLLESMDFVDTEGRQISITDYVEKKNLLIVFTRGFSGRICPYCTTQISRLISNYAEFKQRDTEVLLVYPASTAQLPQFKKAGLLVAGEDSVPFPILLDQDLQAVGKLGIEAQLAKPSTFVLNKRGEVVLSYVGTSPQKRPSIKTLIDVLDQLESRPSVAEPS